MSTPTTCRNPVRSSATQTVPAPRSSSVALWHPTQPKTSSSGERVPRPSSPRSSSIAWKKVPRGGLLTSHPSRLLELCSGTSEKPMSVIPTFRCAPAPCACLPSYYFPHKCMRGNILSDPLRAGVEASRGGAPTHPQGWASPKSLGEDASPATRHPPRSV